MCNKNTIIQKLNSISLVDTVGVLTDTPFDLAGRWIFGQFFLDLDNAPVKDMSESLGVSVSVIKNPSEFWSTVDRKEVLVFLEQRFIDGLFILLEEPDTTPKRARLMRRLGYIELDHGVERWEDLHEVMEAVGEALKADGVVREYFDGLIDENWEYIQDEMTAFKLFRSWSCDL